MRCAASRTGSTCTRGVICHAAASRAAAALSSSLYERSSRSRPGKLSSSARVVPCRTPCCLACRVVLHTVSSGGVPCSTAIALPRKAGRCRSRACAGNSGTCTHRKRGWCNGLTRVHSSAFVPSTHARRHSRHCLSGRACERAPACFAQQSDRRAVSLDRSRGAAVPAPARRCRR